MKRDTASHPFAALIEWFARNHVAANLLMLVLIAGGLWSALTIKKESQPRIDPNMITVSVPFPGASPEDVEEGVLVKIEEAIQDVEGLEKITATGREGSGNVTIEVIQGYDVQAVMDEVKTRVEGISTFPELTETPTVSRTRWTQEVMWISVFGEVDEHVLKDYAKKVRDEIVTLPGVTRADVIGARNDEITIEVSEATLRKYNLTLEQVAQAVRLASLDLPAGNIRTASGDIQVRTKGQAYQGREFEDIVLRTNPDGTRLRVRDIGKVIDGFEDRDRYTLHNGKPAIAIRILSVGNQSELKIAKTVRQYIADKQINLPSGIGVDYWADITYYLNSRLQMMNKNMLGGAILVFAILALFLRLKLAFWVMVGLPVAFFGTLWFMQFADVTVNLLSLFGFLLVLGILVDDAIIIGESIYTHIRRDGHTIDNVISGAHEVAVPATFGVLTTMVAFLPILMVSGISGQFFSAIGWVVILALFFSLVESKLILPAHLAHMKVKPYDPLKANAIARFQRRFSEGMHHFVDRIYMPLLDRALERRYVTLASFSGMLILSFGLLTSDAVKVVYFPELAGDFIRVNIEMNEGTPAAETHRVLDRLLAGLKEADDELTAKYGAEKNAVRAAFVWSGSDITGTIVVELQKEEDAVVSAPEIERRWRERVGEIPGARSLTFSAAGGPDDGPDLAFQLVGNNLEQLAAVAGELENTLRGLEHVYDVQNNFQGGITDIKLTLQPGAEVLGLNLTDLANQVRHAFFGAEAQRILRGKEEVKVMVRYPKEERDSVGNLETMRIRTPGGNEVPFGSVARIEFGSAPAVIRRFDGERAIAVTGMVDKDKAEPGKIIREIIDRRLPEILARYPEVHYRLDGATESQQELNRELGGGALLALFLIYALMAIPLKSYTQPLMIMSVIPFGVIGAVIGHMLLGIPVSLLSMFGLIALAGVVVNDSLVLVDFVNRRAAAGVPRGEAAREAAKARFRAILLTSATTFLGLAPIVFFEKSLQAQIVIPMAASLAFGILFSTIITLLLIPALYLIGDDLRQLMRRWRAAILGHSATQTP